METEMDCAKDDEYDKWMNLAFGLIAKPIAMKWCTANAVFPCLGAMLMINRLHLPSSTSFSLSAISL